MDSVVDERVIEAMGWGLLHSVWELAVVGVRGCGARSRR